MVATHTADTVVINYDDPRLNSAPFMSDVSAKVTSFSVAPTLHHLFPSDDTMRGTKKSNPKVKTGGIAPAATLEAIDGQRATIRFDNKNHETSLKIKGIYNLQNAVGAIALVREIMSEKLDTKRMLASLANVTPAFGRGETVTINQLPCELVLVKNPSGFRLGLKSFESKDYATMIAINDSYADGRDVSWLWDVDFDSLKREGVAVVSGVRAFDMALRLQYDEVVTSKVEPDLGQALAEFIRDNKQKPKRIYCTYTAMLALRRELAKYTDVEAIR
jgi:UDP-N-acetylmuramyl tripeptide synthase